MVHVQNGVNASIYSTYARRWRIRACCSLRSNLNLLYPLLTQESCVSEVSAVRYQHTYCTTVRDKVSNADKEHILCSNSDCTSTGYTSLVCRKCVAIVATYLYQWNRAVQSNVLLCSVRASLSVIEPMQRGAIVPWHNCSDIYSQKDEWPFWNDSD